MHAVGASVHGDLPQSTFCTGRTLHARALLFLFFILSSGLCDRLSLCLSLSRRNTHTLFLSAYILSFPWFILFVSCFGVIPLIHPQFELAGGVRCRHKLF